MCGAYWNDTLQILTCQGIVGSIATGTYVEEGIALFFELVIKPHQQFKRYDMEVSLYEAPCSLIPCHQNCEIWPTVHPNHSSKHWTHFSKLYLMSLRHLDTPTWDERSLIVWSIWLRLPLPDIPQYRKSLTICHKLEAATHGHLGTEPGNHRQVSTSIK